MHRTLKTLACAAALCAAGLSQAAVIQFDSGGLIDIEGGNARYVEAGYRFSGEAASFLLLETSPPNGQLVGTVPGTAFSLGSQDGAAFSLLGLDFAAFDLDGSEPGTLTVTGLRDGLVLGSQDFSLIAGGTVDFGSAFFDVTEVRFVASSGFALDNISVVPTPGTLALAAGGWLLLGWRGARRHARPAGCAG